MEWYDYLFEVTFVFGFLIFEVFMIKVDFALTLHQTLSILCTIIAILGCIKLAITKSLQELLKELSKKEEDKK